MHPYNMQDEYGADVYRRAAKMESPARLNRAARRASIKAHRRVRVKANRAAGILMRKEKP